MSTPGSRPALAESLEAVADAHHGASFRGGGLHRVHHGREAGDGAGAQVVAVGKATRQDDGLGGAERGLLVPDVLDFLAEHVLEDVVGVLVAVGTGKADDSPAHRYFFPAAPASTVST